MNPCEKVFNQLAQFFKYKGKEESVHWLRPLSSCPRPSRPAQGALQTASTFTGT